jgi:hypothetical protein
MQHGLDPSHIETGDESRRDLPPTRSGATFERSDNARGDPATVEISFLRLHAFVANPAFVDARSVECEISANAGDG